MTKSQRVMIWDKNWFQTLKNQLLVDSFIESFIIFRNDIIKQQNLKVISIGLLTEKTVSVKLT